MAYTEQELQEITAAVKSSIVNSGKNTATATELSDIDEVFDLVTHDANGKITRITPENFNKKGKQELLARIQGESKSSSPLKDSFKSLGNFKPNETTLMDTLNAMHGSSSTLGIEGAYRAYNDYDFIEITVKPMSYAQDVWLQTISGILQPMPDGTFILAQKYMVYERTHKNGAWSEWQTALDLNDETAQIKNDLKDEISRATQAEQANKKAIEIAHNPLGLTTTIGIEEFISFYLPDNLSHEIGVQQITFNNGYFKMYDATLSRAVGFTDGGLAVANPTGIREYWCKVVHEGKSYVYYARINWDIVKEVPWSATPAETFTVSPYPRAHSVAGSNLLDMLQRLDYDITKTEYNSDGIAEVLSVTWRDGTTGTATYSDYRADVLEYATLTVTYNSYVKVVQTREYNDTGDLTKKTTTIKNA